MCWPIIGLVLVAMVSLGASCDGGRRGSAEPAHADEASGTRPAGKNRVESIAAIDVSQLTDPERRVWVDLINDLLSPCGDPISVGACAASGSAGGAKACGACVTAARYLARLVAEGYERIEIEEHYNTRFGRDTQKRFALDSTPVRGAPMAPITIVEFSDFECPYCGAAHPLLKETLREFEGKVRLAFKHYPLPSHPRAVPAALAAEAARMQGKFWEMHDLLFANQRRLQDADLLDYARQAGLDVTQFKADVASEKVRGRVEQDRTDGQQAGVDATPTLYVNGRRYQESPRNLAAYLREELEL